MYELLVNLDFSGAHNLKGYRGGCEGLHGHNWKVEARFTSEYLNDIGIAADFKTLKSKLRGIVKKIDHKYLNEFEAFRKKNPSAENIARYIFEEIKTSLRNKEVSVKSISVWESDRSCATYYE